MGNANSSGTNVVITTSSQVINYNGGLPPGTAPTITIGGTPIASPGTPVLPTGFQVVIFDTTKPVTDPSAILLNQYVYVDPPYNSNNWMTTYEGTYEQVRFLLLTTGNLLEQMFFVVSFGLDANMAPTTDALQYFLERGAGLTTQHWETSVDVGSQVGNPTSWVSFPASYILIGGSSYGYNDGYELFQNSAGSATLSATL